jgi:hypothetical protein
MGPAEKTKTTALSAVSSFVTAAVSRKQTATSATKSTGNLITSFDL